MFRDPKYRLSPAVVLPLSRWFVVFLVCGYFLACVVCFYTLVQPSINHQGTFRVGADSGTYLAIADMVRDGSAAGIAFISLNGNLLGPVVLALLLKSGAAIALFNFALFCIAIYAAGKVPGINRWVLVMLLLLNAETFASLITLNKEIVALFSVALLAEYIYSQKKSRLLLIVVLVSALLARWQQFGILLLYFGLRRQGSFLAKKPKLALALLICFLTVAYPVTKSTLNLSELTNYGETGGTITTLNAMQAHFLFPLVLIPKAAMNLCGQLVTPRFFLNEYWTRDFNDLQNQFLIQLHTVAMVLACLALVVLGRARLKEPLVFFSAVYLIVTALTPFVQPRYQYPVYVAFCVELARKRSRAIAYPGARTIGSPVLLRFQIPRGRQAGAASASPAAADVLNGVG